MNLLIHFAVFGCLGITTEIFFTAITDEIARYREHRNFNWSLTGKSYIWMFFIYGSAAIFFPIGWSFIGPLPMPLRLLIYTLGIFAVEYVTGWLLDVTTGKCPWEYDSKWAINGYIRLDYAPLWFMFGFLLEVVFLQLHDKYPVSGFFGI